MSLFLLPVIIKSWFTSSGMCPTSPVVKTAADTAVAFLFCIFQRVYMFSCLSYAYTIRLTKCSWLRLAVHCVSPCGLVVNRSWRDSTSTGQMLSTVPVFQTYPPTDITFASTFHRQLPHLRWRLTTSEWCRLPVTRHPTSIRIRRMVKLILPQARRAERTMMDRCPALCLRMMSGVAFLRPSDISTYRSTRKLLHYRLIFCFFLCLLMD